MAEAIESKEVATAGSVQLVLCDLEILAWGKAPRRVSHMIEVGAVSCDGRHKLHLRCWPKELKWSDLPAPMQRKANQCGLDEHKLPPPLAEQWDSKVVPFCMGLAVPEIVWVAHNGLSWDFFHWRQYMQEQKLSWPENVRMWVLDSLPVLKDKVRQRLRAGASMDHLSFTLGNLYRRTFRDDIVDQHRALPDAAALRRLWLFFHHVPSNHKRLLTSEIVAQLVRAVYAQCQSWHRDVDGDASSSAVVPGLGPASWVALRVRQPGMNADRLVDMYRQLGGDKDQAMDEWLKRMLPKGVTAGNRHKAIAYCARHS